MKIKKLIQFALLLSIPMLLCLASCQKQINELFEGEQIQNKSQSLFATKLMATACGGSETKESEYFVTINQPFPSNPEIQIFQVTQKTKYFCDGLSWNIYERLVQFDELTKPIDTSEFIQEAPISSPVSSCSTNRFDIDNIIHFNPGLKMLDRSVLEQVYNKVRYYYENEYSGIYYLSELDTHGYGSGDKLIYATFGYLTSSLLSRDKMKTAFNNIPSTYVGNNNGCDQSRYQLAAVKGADYYHYYKDATDITLTLPQAFDHFLYLIVSNQM